MKITKLSFILVCILGLVACSEEQDIGTVVTSKSTTLRFSFGVSSMKEADETGSTSDMCCSTRSADPSSVNEDAIDNLWIFQFVDGVYVRGQYFSKVNSDMLDIDLSVNSEGQTSDLYFIANMGEETFKGKTFASESACNDFAYDVTSEESILPTAGFLPMSAILTGVKIPDDFQKSTAIVLTRMVARVDLNYSVTSSMPAGFKLTHARLVNVAANIYPYVVTGLPLVSSTVVDFDYTALATQSGELTFYLPDNHRGKGTNGTADVTKKNGVANATCIQLIGYKGGDEFTYSIYLGNDDTNDYNLAYNTHYTVTAKLDGISDTDLRMKKTPIANTYMVKPGSYLHIPVKRANQSDLGEQLADVTSGWHSEVIWRDNSALTITNDDALKSVGFFELKATDATADGNALVCIKDDEGNILWSWHIWVTNYDPETDNETYNNCTWMDRNLGATNDTPGDVGALGLMYEWGRKDPIVGSSVVSGNDSPKTLYSGDSGNEVYSVPKSIYSVASANNLEISVRNPAAYLWGGRYDWYCGSSEEHNNTLWGTTKTVYDPCPSGWKVPDEGCWASTEDVSDWDDEHHGFTITSVSGSWYPAAGCYESEYDELYDAGKYADYWLSSADNADASEFAYHHEYSVKGVSKNPYRDYGYPVRCIKEN
ncbi:MAG: DUF4906 domain-containing protein [Bacteroides sp.]|jgi:uncharacterized protein (TIGR02145 family)|nr:DUF4906 domain-containing protein [Bacteroides sp.]